METKKVIDEPVRNISFDILAEVEIVLRGIGDEGFEDTKDSLAEGIEDSFQARLQLSGCVRSQVTNMTPLPYS